MKHVFQLPRGAKKGAWSACRLSKKSSSRNRLEVLAFLMALSILLATVTTVLLPLIGAHWRGWERSLCTQVLWEGRGSKPRLLTIGIFLHFVIVRSLCEPLQHLGDGQLSQPGVPAGTQLRGGI